MLNQDYYDILYAFIENDVSFLVVGAYALAAHGNVRATGDIDLWIDANEDNAKKVLSALKDFGAPLFDLKLKDLSTSGNVFQIGNVPRRVDIITSIDGVMFKDAWVGKLEIEIDSLKLSVIGKEDLLKNKKASGRPKDLVDAKWLEEN